MAIPVTRRCVRPDARPLALAALGRGWLAALLMCLLAGCGARYPGDEKLLELSEEELFQSGRAAMDKGDRDRARGILRRYEVRYPRGAHIEQAKFIVAETFYQDRLLEEKVEGVALFRSFLTFYPRHALACDAQFRIAEYYGERMRSPERDQTETRQAINEAQKLLATYPDCDRRQDAEELLASALDRLAESEYAVAAYYLKTGNPRGAAQRLQELLDRYPQYGRRGRTYHTLIKALKRLGELDEARLVFDKLSTELGDSEWIGKARSELGLGK